MATHTIRQKSSATPIYSLTPAFLKVMLAANPDASSLAMGSFQRQYRLATGKSLRLDHLQEQQFLERFGANEQGHWQSTYQHLGYRAFVVINTFKDGFLSQNLAFDKALALASDFYALIDATYANPSWMASRP